MIKMVWKDLIGALISFLVFGLIIFGFVLWARADENYREKKDCYEIYATDNVILKKCERYFKD